MQKLNFIKCIHLLDTCIRVNLIQKVDNDHIYVYKEKNNINPEGWYVENIMTAAQDLLHDEKGQLALIQALEQKGILFDTSTR